MSMAYIVNIDRQIYEIKQRIETIDNNISTLNRLTEVIPYHGIVSSLRAALFNIKIALNHLSAYNEDLGLKCERSKTTT